MYIEAFLMGFIGSLHCVLMCGPLAMAVGKIHSERFIETRVLYNLGRLLTYSFLGFVAGILGKVINLSKYQEILSITIGSIFILATILMVSKYRFTPVFINRFIGYLKMLFGKYLKKQGLFSSILLGILNGFLPCGLVYMAATASTLQPTLLNSVIFMMFFGLGTFPALLFSMNIFLTVSKYISFQKLIPLFLSILGILLIMRGLQLGIPYLSPGKTGHHHMTFMDQLVNII